MSQLYSLAFDFIRISHRFPLTATVGTNPQREHRMSEQPTAETPATDAPAETEVTEPKPTETVEFWKQKAREQEKRAKENSRAADELSQIRESQKSEAEKSADRIKQLEAEVESTRLGATRFQIAAEFQLTEKQSAALAHAASEEGMRELAEAFKAETDTRKKQGNHVPKEGATSTPSDGGDLRDFTRKLFDVAD